VNGQLPGDIRIERKGWFFYFPITSGIIVSLVLWLFRRRAGAGAWSRRRNRLRPATVSAWRHTWRGCGL